MSELYENLTSPIEYFCHWERETPDKVFLRQPFGNSWHTLTYRQAGMKARKMATALTALGLKKGDHIGILSKNCYHWILADLAIMMGGFVSVPFYPSLPKAQLNEVIRQSDIRCLFVGKLDSWGDRSEAVPESVTLIRFPHYPGNAPIEKGLEWDQLTRSHDPLEEDCTPSHDDIWTILFTSGTTGSPKGVIHNFRAPALVMRGEELSNFLGVFQIDHPKFFSFLPLNHVAERIAVETACLATGGSISFAESIDTFLKNLQDTQPTTIFAVPRIWTKFYLGVTEKIPQKTLNLLLRLPVISGQIKKKIRQTLGLRDARIVATGAAITPAFLKDWYKKLDIHLVEAYGMTEVCGLITSGPQLDTPADSVGTAIPFCEIQIAPETQEVLMKAPSVMLGYYKDPEKTAEVLKDGWIFSGDKGTLDKKGFLHIIGRVKDAFKTAKGQYIMPNPLERELARNEYVEQVCVAGMTTPQPIALVNLSESGLQTDGKTVESSLEQTLMTLNTTLASYQRISTIVIHREPWTEENELLTPTLKVRRGKIDEQFGEKFLGWHEQSEMVIWE